MAGYIGSRVAVAISNAYTKAEADALYATTTQGALADTAVQPSSTDTLVNKTLTAPAINGAVSGDSLSTQAEAEAGTNNDQLMTPLRTAQAITALAISSTTAGAVGTYALAYNTTAILNYGSTVAGSTVRPCSVALTYGTNAFQAGTWRCMGYSANTGGAPTTGATTVFLRIS